MLLSRRVVGSVADQAHGAENGLHAQAVERRGDAWVATCDHGDEVWYLERGTEHNAWRSLRAHSRWEHADLRPAAEWPDARVLPPAERNPS